MNTITRDGLAHLVDAIRPCLTERHDLTAAAVADALRVQRPTADILSAQERLGDEHEPRLIDLHTEERFSIQAVVWQPGQESSIHDHVTWCAFGVLQGVEEETIYRDRGTHLTVLDRSINRVGEYGAIAPPGDIHRVRNAGAETTITLHVYGADLSEGQSSVCRVYKCPVVGSAPTPVITGAVGTNADRLGAGLHGGKTSREW